MFRRSFTILYHIVLLAVVSTSCAQSEFAGDSGQGVRVKNKPNNPSNPSPGPGPTDTTPGPSNPNSSDGSKPNVDDGGRVELVDAELIISKSDDRAAWKNCLYAGIQGQPDVEIGCNRDSPNGTRLPQKSTKIKLKTNECNQLRLVLYTQRPGEKTPTPNISTVGSVSRFQIQKLEPRKFQINANDNFDSDWLDLMVTIYSTDPKIKFTIQGSSIPCD